MKKCLICNKKLELGKSSRGKCKRCYDRWRYHNIPKVKRYMKKYYKKYYKEHKFSEI